MAIPGSAFADSGSARDSVYLIGEFADPVCVFQHGMSGVNQKACAAVPGRVDQGMAFLDIRQHRIYTVIGLTHTESPRETFLALLGDTIAVRARVWKAGGREALAINAVYPVSSQPRPCYAWWPWQWHASVLTGCGLLACAYLIAMGPLRRRLGGPERFEAGRASMYLGGLAVVVVALNGPVHDLSDQYLFSTHMVQHLMLAEVFPPLLLLGIPGWLADRILQRRGAAAWRLLTAAPASFGAYTLVLIIWHLPPLYELIMRSHGFHVLMHLMVMGTSVLVWWGFLGTARDAPRLNPPVQLLFAFLLGIPMMAVAAPITLADHALYQWYALAPRLFELSALQDQQLGGVIMWVLGGLVYWGVASVIFLRWAAREVTAQDKALATP